MLSTIFGLPLHPLIVHATVVFVPAATLMVAASAIWPRVRARLVWPAVAVSVVATGLVAAAALSGESLAHRLPANPLIAHHAQLAKILAVLVVLQTGAVTVLAYLHWRHAGTPIARWLRVPPNTARMLLRTHRWLTHRWLNPLVRARWIMPLAVALSIVTASGTLVQIVVVGDSGARAVWSPVMRATAHPAGGRGLASRIGPQVPAGPVGSPGASSR